MNRCCLSWLVLDHESGKRLNLIGRSSAGRASERRPIARMAHISDSAEGPVTADVVPVVSFPGLAMLETMAEGTSCHGALFLDLDSDLE